MPAVGDSTGLSLGWASVRKLLVSMLAVSMVASLRTSGSGSMAAARTTMSVFMRNLAVVQQIRSLHQQSSLRGSHFSHLPFNIMDAVLFHGPPVKLIKVFAGSTHINIEYRYIHIRIFVPDQHGVFGCVHAADLGTVAFVPAGLSPGTHALDKNHGFRGLMVGQLLQMAFPWALPRS